MSNNSIFFSIKQLTTGGAGRVICMLSGAADENGRKTTLILTHQSLDKADLSRVAPGVDVISLPDEIKKIGRHPSRFKIAALRVCSKLTKLLPNGKEKQKIVNYKLRNLASIEWLERFFSENKGASAVAFLYDSIFLTLLSANKTNRVIISDRGDPSQSTSCKTDLAFFKYMFPKADAMVFQSPDVKKWYKDNYGIAGTVIFNPIKPDLPEPFTGERRKKIVNFCRISSQKNLLLLIDAFVIFEHTHPEYELLICGDATGNGAEGYADKLKEKVALSGVQEKIHLLPACSDIHTKILDCAMFVSSSDFEGMSNSMLEAMAIGLPCVCTDCPAGGARAVIRDHENGLLVPVGDTKALARAMSEIVDDPVLAARLSASAVKIRESQSIEIITSQWMEIING